MRVCILDKLFESWTKTRLFPSFLCTPMYGSLRNWLNIFEFLFSPSACSPAIQLLFLFPCF